MGYSNDESIVRVDRFKPSGKWIDDLAINMGAHYNDTIIQDALRDALRESGFELGYYTFVCLEPYHKHSHPIMIRGE